MRVDTLSNSYCSSEPFSCAAIEQDCTPGLVIQIFNGSYDAGIDVVFPHREYISTREYDVIKMLLLTDVFSEGTL